MLDPQTLTTVLSVLALLAGLLVSYVLVSRRYVRKVSRLQARTRMLMDDDETRSRELDVLRKREAWYADLFNSSQDPVFVHAVDDEGAPGCLVEVNQAACDLLGYSREKLLTMTPFDLEAGQAAAATPGYTLAEWVTRSDHDLRERKSTLTIRREIRDVLEKGHAHFEKEFLHRDGDRIPLEIAAHRLAFRGEIMIMCTARDVSERHRAETAQKQSERRFRDFFMNSPTGVVMYDAQRRLVDVNRSCLRFFGAADAAEFAKFDLFDNPFVPARVKSMLARGETVRFEATVDFEEARTHRLFVTSKRGQSHFNIMMANLGHDEDYRPKGYLAQIQDISKRRDAEQALRERSRELRQAQKMEAIGTLAGGIAHDFNNILTPIMGYTEIAIRSGKVSDTIIGYMQEIHKAAQRAKELVNQVLAFSRQGESETRMMAIHISPIVKEVVKLLRASIPTSIRIEQAIKTDEDMVMGDATQVHQIVMNLCTNALHAMRESGGVLDVRVMGFTVGRRAGSEYSHLEPGHYLRLVFRDTGRGIDAAIVDRIFEPFFTTKRRGVGTGMGLSVVHGIVTAMKGAISVESVVGKGSAFDVILPLVETDSSVDDEVLRPLPVGNERILYVDDEEDSARMGAHMLDSLGYDPALARSPSEALELFPLTPEQFDLIVTDHLMPGMNGLEFAEPIHTLRPDIPVTVCTGYAEALDEDLLRDVAVAEVVPKPIERGTLAMATRSALDRTRQEKASR